MKENKWVRESSIFFPQDSLTSWVRICAWLFVFKSASPWILRFHSEIKISPCIAEKSDPPGSPSLGTEQVRVCQQ